MELSQLTQSGRIYLSQINNYLQKGQGYPQIRSYLLKQLNQLDGDNLNSDDTLIPAIVQRLRKQIVSQSNQNLSRAIDVMEDLLKYTNKATESYFCTQQFCQSLFIAIAYQKIIVLNKILHNQNKLRLSSIVLYYYQKFQSNPNHYTHILKLYKDLKERNCEFPPQTFINIPKNNQFRTKKKNRQLNNQKVVSITFDSIKQFVKQTENKFNQNKLSFTNTQFVRALKIKAKTLFDISQDQQKSIVLNKQQKQQAKVLYKKIRGMLKQIEKLNEQKIKQQKIKSEKQFAQQKIQQITPKKKQSNISSLNTGSIKKKIQQTNGKQKQSIDLLDIQQIKQINSIKKSSSLLDDDQKDQTIYINSGLLDIGQRQITYESPKKQVSIKKIAGPPKYQDLLGDNDNDINSQQKIISLQQKQTLLIDTVNTPLDFSIKSIHSQHSLGGNSVTSQQSNKGIRNIQTSPNNLSNVKQQQKNSNQGYVFDNQQLFSRFQIIKRFKDPNNYNQLLNDVDFSDRSSQSYKQGQRVTFQTNDDIFDNEDKDTKYNKTFTPNKKQTSFVDNIDNKIQISKNNNDKLSLSANYNKIQQPLAPNYNFGILADNRQVKAYDYTNVIHNNNTYQGSSVGTQQQQRKIQLTPKSVKHSIKSHKSAQELSPQIMNFNSTGQINNNKINLADKDQNDDDQFQQYQKGGQSLFDQSNNYSKKQQNLFISPKNKQKNKQKNIYQDLQSPQQTSLKNNQLFL